MLTNGKTIALSLLICTACSPGVALRKSKSAESNTLQQSINLASEDPYLWLEDIESPKALDYVKKQNTLAETYITHATSFKEILAVKKQTIQQDDFIPEITVESKFIRELKTSPENLRGVWRQTDINAFHTSPNNAPWVKLIDLDALSKIEQKSWVWGGALCLAPEFTRCLITLSDGGKDASVIREFDTRLKTFLSDGFQMPEGKHSAQWIDENTLGISPDLGPDSQTDSGYPRTVRIWKRGTRLQDAKTIFSGEKTDIGSFVTILNSPSGQSFFITRSVDFFTPLYFLVDSDFNVRPIETIKGSDLVANIDQKAIFLLRSDLISGNETFKQGSLVSVELNESQAIHKIFEPNDTSSISSVSQTKDGLVLNLLSNVTTQFLFAKWSVDAWKTEPIAIPELSSVSVVASNPFNSEYYTVSDNFLTPSTLFLKDTSNNQKETVLKSLKSQFDAAHFIAEQKFALSRDGTRIPYFIVRNKNMPFNGLNPTLLYGYGGFEISLTPNYLGDTGTNWLERGGVYVLANIRGGGEYGPKWHQAALKENRQLAFDDFIAVAEDLIQSKVTSPSKLGIRGGSNGGLLVGAVMVQRPDLFKAVVCDVPLLDMLRYNKLLAGASWEGEYGNPDENSPAAEAIRKYSPYQNVKAELKMPSVLFTTSTKDDRVHPGHARKMQAKMQDQGHNVFLYENFEGGHGSAADKEQQAFMGALRLSFLWEELNK